MPNGLKVDLFAVRLIFLEKIGVACFVNTPPPRTQRERRMRSQARRMPIKLFLKIEIDTR